MSKGLGRVEKDILKKLQEAKGHECSLYALVDVSKDSHFQERKAAWESQNTYRHYGDGYPSRCYHGNYGSVKRAVLSLELKGLVECWVKGGKKIVFLSVPASSSAHLRVNGEIIDDARFAEFGR